MQPGTGQPSAGSTTPAQLCSKVDYTEGGTCLREITMQFNLKNACIMDGTATIQVCKYRQLAAPAVDRGRLARSQMSLRQCRDLSVPLLQDMVINCAADVAAVDCPLQAPAQNNSIVLAIKSENYCVPGGAANSIDGVISTIFLAPDQSYLKRGTNGDAQQPVWAYGRPIYMRLDMSSAVKVQGLSPILLSTQFYQSGTSPPGFMDVYCNDAAKYLKPIFPPAMFTGPVPPDPNRVTVPSGGNLGLDMADQSYLMMHTIDSIFTAGGNNPPGGSIYNLDVRLLFQVAYTQQGRRRSRQASHSSAQFRFQNAIEGQGSALMPTQSVTSYVDPSLTATAATTDSSSGGGSNIGLIAGIAAGVCAAVLLAVVGIIMFVSRKMRKDRVKKRRQIANATAGSDDEDDDADGGVRVGAGAGASGRLEDKKGLQSKGRKQDLENKRSVGKSNLEARQAAGEKKSKNELARMNTHDATLPMGGDVEAVVVEAAAYPAQSSSKGKKKNQENSGAYTV